MSDTPTAADRQATTIADGEVSVQDYVDRLAAELTAATQRAIQAESLAARYLAERDEARAAVDQVIGTAKPGDSDTEA